MRKTLSKPIRQQEQKIFCWTMMQSENNRNEFLGWIRHNTSLSYWAPRLLATWAFTEVGETLTFSQSFAQRSFSIIRCEHEMLLATFQFLRGITLYFGIRFMWSVLWFLWFWGSLTFHFIRRLDYHLILLDKSTLILICRMISG